MLSSGGLVSSNLAVPTFTWSQVWDCRIRVCTDDYAGSSTGELFDICDTDRLGVADLRRRALHRLCLAGWCRSGPDGAGRSLKSTARRSPIFDRLGGPTREHRPHGIGR